MLVKNTIVLVLMIVQSEVSDWQEGLSRGCWSQAVELLAVPWRESGVGGRVRRFVLG